MHLILAAAAMWISAPAAACDTFTIRLDEDARTGPATGRIMLFFTPADGRWSRVAPISGPFFSSPQPIASVAVEALVPGDVAIIDGSAAAYPDSINKLDGRFRVQAILDADDTERSASIGPGNVVSEPIVIELSPDRDDAFSITLGRPVDGMRSPAPADNLFMVEFKSELLSEFYGRPVFHRAGLAMPPAYLEAGNEEKKWPAIYMIPGYGGRHTAAGRYARMLRNSTPDIAPRAVHIMLDPESPLGHHGFVDSANHGPRGTALVTELIPHLESNFRLAARPEARLLTGHSSCGWSSLWLQLNWPNVFGGCWSSSPDPIDFSAFQLTDLYAETNLYKNGDGEDTASYRQQTPAGERVMMTVRQEGLMEYAMHPAGGSGERWDAWEAMFSTPDQQAGLPKPMFDARTGAIDREVIEHWKQFDITRLVANDWETYGPIVTGKVRLACGELDNFYLHRAVKGFKETVDKLAGESIDADEAPGYVWLIRFATHGNMAEHTTIRWHEEMKHHLREHGLHE